jgi:hypothetical protein
MVAAPRWLTFGGQTTAQTDAQGRNIMPLVIGFAFFIGIVVLVLLGSNLLGPDSWPMQSDREAARCAQANADRLRQRSRGAVPETG